MGQSTNGQICYGIILEEEEGDVETSWDAEGYDGDIEEWWKDKKGWKPSLSIWTEEGKAVAGITQEQQDFYYNEIREWEKANPLPIELVNYCSDDYPMYIAAVPKTMKSCSRGFPEPFKPDELVFDVKKAETALAFLKEYKIPVNGTKLEWLLTSYWG